MIFGQLKNPQSIKTISSHIVEGDPAMHLSLNAMRTKKGEHTKSFYCLLEQLVKHNLQGHMHWNTPPRLPEHVILALP